MVGRKNNQTNQLTKSDPSVIIYRITVAKFLMRFSQGQTVEPDYQREGTKKKSTEKGKKNIISA